MHTNNITWEAFFLNAINNVYKPRIYCRPSNPTALFCLCSLSFCDHALLCSKPPKTPGKRAFSSKVGHWFVIYRQLDLYFIPKWSPLLVIHISFFLHYITSLWIVRLVSAVFVHQSKLMLPFWNIFVVYAVVLIDYRTMGEHYRQLYIRNTSTL